MMHPKLGTHKKDAWYIQGTLNPHSLQFTQFCYARQVIAKREGREIPTTANIYPTNNVRGSTLRIHNLICRQFGPPAVIERTDNGKPLEYSWIDDNSYVVLAIDGDEEGLGSSGCVYLHTIDYNAVYWYESVIRPFIINKDDQESLLHHLGRRAPSEPLSCTSHYVNMPPLIRDNYPPSVLEKYDQAVLDLKDECPMGRILLLDGPPGTGKTFMIRGIMKETKCWYMLINPGAFDDLSDPEFMEVLSEEFNSKRPIVLILEDGDKLLAPRNKGISLSGLSSLLNMGDGLMSNIFDIRIIITTNTNMEEIDPAVIRSGRLSQHIHLPELEREHAHRILNRLRPDSELGDKEDPWVLSDVYRRARELGWRNLRTFDDPRSLNEPSPGKKIK